MEQETIAEGPLDRRAFVAQSTTERDKLLRTFPNPPLPTHRTAYRWTTDMRVEVWQEPVPAGDAAAAPVAPPNPLDKLPADLVAKVRAMKPADLETYAAEQGMALPDNWKRMPHVQRTTSILTFLAEKQAK